MSVIAVCAVFVTNIFALDIDNVDDPFKNNGQGITEVDEAVKNIDAGDELDLDIKAGTLKNLTKGTITVIEPLPDVMIKLLEDGGLIEHIKKNGDLVLG